MWLGWVCLVRALEKFLLLLGVNKMPNHDRLQPHFAFARVCGPYKAPGGEEQHSGAAAKTGFPGFQRRMEASS